MTGRIQTIGQTSSTSADILALISDGAPPDEGFWLIADRQSDGKGRQGRAWIDAPGNFMGSTIVHLNESDPPAPTLSFVAALAVYGAVVPLLANPQGLQLKWPNDVLLGGVKFCGLLLERKGPHLVLGVGVNLIAAPLLSDRQTASLAQSGPPPSRDGFADSLSKIFALELQKWRSQETANLFERWGAVAHAVGKPLAVHDSGGEKILGTFGGLEADGSLRLRLADGSCRVIHAGDVELET